MKITKRHLRRIIKEEKQKLKEYGGRPYDPTVPGDWEHQEEKILGGYPGGPVEDESADPVDDYIGWAEANGHMTPAASSVVASYIVEDPKREAYKVMIANSFGMMVSEISRDVKRQQAEKAAMMGESKMKITKRQLKRIVKEETSRLNTKRGRRENLHEGLGDVKDGVTAFMTMIDGDPGPFIAFLEGHPKLKAMLEKGSGVKIRSEK